MIGYDLEHKKAPATRERPGAWTDLDRRPIMPNRTATIRQLRSGEKVPDFEPRRYASAQGYVRLRWRIAPGEYVEAYEHRVFDGRVTTAPEVHHRDRDRANNDPTNLLPTTVEDHHKHHREVDRAAVVELYQSGMSTPEVGAALGCNPATAYRILKAEGVKPRSLSESQLYGLDADLVRRLHSRGVRVRRIAAALGCSPQPVQTLVDILGLTPHREGRPTDIEILQAQAALRLEGLA